MYAKGFSHNNCGGRCIKQGIRQWGILHQWKSNQYQEAEDWETDMRKTIDYTIVRDRKRGMVIPTPLSELKPFDQYRNGKTDMRYFSLFSGIGSFEYGFPDSWECIGYSEIDKYAMQVYRRHFNHENFGDATAIDTVSIPDFDLLCAGFPCQDFSVAGERAGLEGLRGMLFFEIIRILRDKRPRYFLLENVKGLLNSGDYQDFPTVLGILTECGYDLQWSILNSKDHGVPQNRERMFIVGHLREFARPEVFPIGVGNGSFDTSRNGKDSITAGCLGTRGASGQSQFDGSTTVIVQKSGYCDYRVCSDISPALMSAANTGGNHQGGATSKVPLVAIASTHYGKHQQDRVYNPNGIMCQVSAGTHGSGGHLLKNRDGTRFRRLTPIEYERLQAFPDGFTEWGIDEQSKKVKISDTQRYKMLGNAITTTVIKAIATKF